MVIWNNKKGVGIGAIVLIGAVFTTIVTILWGVATVSKNYQVQLERTPSIKAKARFDHLKHYSNYSLFLSGHWGTEEYGKSRKTWWKEGSNLVPTKKEFKRRLSKNITHMYEIYFQHLQKVETEGLEVNVTDITPENFTINSSGTLKVSGREYEDRSFETEKGKEVKVMDEVNFSRTIDLRIPGLWEMGRKFTDHTEGLLKYPIWEKFQSATEDEETRTGNVCKDTCQRDDYPAPQPTDKEKVVSELNEKLNSIAGTIEGKDGVEDFIWSLSIGEVEDFKTKVDRYPEPASDTGKSCKCKVNVTAERTWSNRKSDCQACKDTGDGCWEFASWIDEEDGDCRVKVTEVRTWNSLNDCENCRDGNNCVEFVDSLQTRHKCKIEYDYFYNITPTVKVGIKDGNNNYRIFGDEGFKESLNLKFFIGLEKISTTEDSNPFEEESVDKVFQE